MFFSYKKRTKRILNISKGRAPGVVLSPVFMGGLQVTVRQAVGRHAPMPPGIFPPPQCSRVAGSADPCNDP